jgi:hypothetical protein
VFFKWGWKISAKTRVMWSTFREHAGIPKEAGNMSDQDREKLAQGTEDAELTPEDVEAHVKARGANDEADEEVRAHVKTRGANDDDAGDDVEAHVKQR